MRGAAQMLSKEDAEERGGSGRRRDRSDGPGGLLLRTKVLGLYVMRLSFAILGAVNVAHLDQVEVIGCRLSICEKCSADALATGHMQMMMSIIRNKGGSCWKPMLFCT